MDALNKKIKNQLGSFSAEQVEAMARLKSALRACYDCGLEVGYNIEEQDLMCINPTLADDGTMYLGWDVEDGDLYADPTEVGASIGFVARWELGINLIIKDGKNKMKQKYENKI